MSAETAAVVVAVKCGCMVVGGIALVALCGYGLYRLFRKEDPHDHKNVEDTGVLLTTVDDLVAENNNNVTRQNANNQRKLDDDKIKELERKISKLEKELEVVRNSKKTPYEKNLDFVADLKSPSYNEKVLNWFEDNQKS